MESRVQKVEQALKMRVETDFSYRQIARRLGVTEGTAYNYVNQAKTEIDYVQTFRFLKIVRNAKANGVHFVGLGRLERGLEQLLDQCIGSSMLITEKSREGEVIKSEIPHEQFVEAFDGLQKLADDMNLAAIRMENAVAKATPLKAILQRGT